MAFKAILVLCAQALLVKTISGQYLNGGCSCSNSNLGLVNNALPNNGLWAGSSYGLGNIAASNGGGLAVQSLSPISPSGVSVQSSNAIEGALLVNGNLPFLSAVALEGLVSSAGQGDVAYTSGNGNIGIVSENYAPTAAFANNGLGLINAGIGNAGLINGVIGNAGLINGGIGNAGHINAGIGNAGLYNAGFSNAGHFNAGLGVSNIGGCGCNSLY